jgi:transcriptional regulator with XRE-family HTH domain
VGKFLGDRLRERREGMGLSTPKLAKISGVSQSSISDYELGKKQPRLKQLEKLCQALEIKHESYFYDKEMGIPIDSLSVDMPGELTKFIMDADNAKYIELGMMAKESALPYETIKQLLQDSRQSTKRFSTPKDAQVS